MRLRRLLRDPDRWVSCDTTRDEHLALARKWATTITAVAAMIIAVIVVTS